MVAEREGLLEQRVARGRLPQREQEGALGGRVAARAARHPRRLAEPAHHLAARQLTPTTLYIIHISSTYKPSSVLPAIVLGIGLMCVNF